MQGNVSLWSDWPITHICSLDQTPAICPLCCRLRNLLLAGVPGPGRRLCTKPVDWSSGCPQARRAAVKGVNIHGPHSIKLSPRNLQAMEIQEKQRKGEVLTAEKAFSALPGNAGREPLPGSPELSLGRWSHRVGFLFFSPRISFSFLLLLLTPLSLVT